MGLFAIDEMAGSGAYPLQVIAAPNEAEAGCSPRAFAGARGLGQEESPTA